MKRKKQAEEELQQAAKNAAKSKVKARKSMLVRLSVFDDDEANNTLNLERRDSDGDMPGYRRGSQRKSLASVVGVLGGNRRGSSRKSVVGGHMEAPAGSRRTSVAH